MTQNLKGLIQGWNFCVRRNHWSGWSRDVAWSHDLKKNHTDCAVLNDSERGKEMKMDQPGGYLLLQKFQWDMIVAWIRVVAVETVRGRCI